MAVKEVCLAARTFHPKGAQAGDVMVVREPLGYIGGAEGKDFIWLLMEEANLPTRELLEEPFRWGKFRFHIHLPSLVSQYPDLSLRSVADKRAWYQPLLGTNDHTGWHTRSTVALVSVRDKGA